LLGRYNYERYGKALEKGAADHEYTILGDINVRSTDIYRTIQSGYSELLGFAYYESYMKKTTLPKISAS